jgi:hypothetical protein
MAAKKNDLDVELQRLYGGPLDTFTAARNDLAKQLRKLGQGPDAERVKTLAKPTPSAWAVNVLFDRERERMDDLLAAGKRARAGQREAVSGRGPEALRESLGAVRKLIDELRRRAAAFLAESGRSVSRTMIERIGTDLQALALSPAVTEEASRRWLDRDLDPPGFEVLAGLQLAGAPVVDMAARRARREAKAPEKREARPAEKAGLRPTPVPSPPKPKGESEREKKERERRAAVEQARQERETERIRRRVEVAEEKVERARNEADSLREEAEEAEKAASEARRRVEAAELAASRTRDKADRAAERLTRAEDELKEAKAGP